MKKQEKKILLVISGGIAAYKSLELIRLLNNEGISVLPLMTESAKSFVTPLSVSVISGEKVASEMFDVESEMNFSHIELSRAAGLVVVAPATANILAKFANGLADDLASTVLLATDKKVLVAGSIPPLSESYRFDLVPDADEAIPIYENIARALLPYVDIFICETMSTMSESANALGAIRNVIGYDRPVWVSWTDRAWPRG